MPNLSTTYAGLVLKSPIIAGSSGLTATVDHLVQIEKAGAGAVVLKSIFEEEITAEYDKILAEAEKSGMHSENLDYFDYKIKQDKVNQYIKLIHDAKKNLSIPVFASVNCASAHEWTFFAKQIEDSGADGLELNIFIAPSDFSQDSAAIEKRYFDIVQSVRSKVKLPIVVKLSPFFTNLGSMIVKMSEQGLGALVLFNRFFSPDIDIHRKQVIPTHVFSTPEEMAQSLKWIALSSGKVSCNLAASGGIHTGEAVVKQILAGADAVQIATALYQHGFSHIETMLNEIEAYMQKNNYSKIENFKGMMAGNKSQNHILYERAQFMKYFSEKDKN